MKVSVKKLKDLERKITIKVPVEDYESKFNSKIKQCAPVSRSSLVLSYLYGRDVV